MADDKTAYAIDVLGRGIAEQVATLGLDRNNWPGLSDDIWERVVRAVAAHSSLNDRPHVPLVDIDAAYEYLLQLEAVRR